jgi:hypothetical protein
MYLLLAIGGCAGKWLLAFDIKRQAVCHILWENTHTPFGFSPICFSDTILFLKLEFFSSILIFGAVSKAFWDEEGL